MLREAPPRVVLFLCSGNYYRSRFAEAIFNHRATAAGLRWVATSAGLRPDHFRFNPGTISSLVTEGLSARGIAAAPPRAPLAVCEADLESAARVIAMKESEHRPVIAANFPRWTDRVVYWNVEDVMDAAPFQTLRAIDHRVDELIEALVEAPSWL